ncbi:hypothetical protein OIU84_010462 [Salix udensis]|uniref:Uncharacterized protein n=1 Tax=Salix udensis TaxID=889485 RepID=A0AAD6JKS5_9ROSI|nr:hypothetical protein OIU84_010462 [Salix udensis]
MGVVSSPLQPTAATLERSLGNMAMMNGARDGQASNGKWKDLFSSNRRADSGTKLATPIEQQSSDEPPWPTNNEEATWPINYEEPVRLNDVQGSSSLNESFDEQRVDPMLMETDVDEWTIVKNRNGKNRVANDTAVVVTSLGVPVSSVGTNVDPLCGVTARSGIRRTSVFPRSKGLKA